MRKHRQKQIIELLATLREANAEIKKLALAGDISAAVRLLSDSQAGARQIGCFIEQFEGENTNTVPLLEEYCEVLYRASLEITEAGQDTSFLSLSQLKKQLVVIENSVKTEFAPDRIEIAFIPYKASMWDALESVWLAAQNDPACDAYVVPAPYYDRLPGGAFGQMQYEGHQYPDYVPVVDWQNYDFEERRPDMIFTHNPYDEGNWVTSIHPGFYNKRLKEFTDLLVYIPYFVVAGDVPEHFCVCAGTLYADSVIVQSEKIRQTYIRAFKEFERQNNCRNSFGRPEDKFLALGSPKFDKVIKTKREDCDIPDQWRRLSEKPDGTRKKVVLYNTTIDALLKGDEKVLAKLRHVFEQFQNRDDIVLLWRPHPLNEAAYRAMRPQLWREYESIAAEYRRAGFGIYDDTADLHRAIAWSDAYYGDWSSLVAMYTLTGKPVMTQNIDILAENKRGVELLFESCYDDGENIWFGAFWFNGLFKCGKETWVVEYIGQFPGEKPGGVRLFADVAECGGRLYFAPYSAEAIAVYDLTDGTFERIDLRAIDRKRFKNYNAETKFSHAVSHGGYVFLIPGLYPAIVRIDAGTCATIYIDNWIKDYESCCANPAWYFYGVATVGAKLYAASCLADAVAIIDLAGNECTFRKIGQSEFGYNAICFDGDNFRLSPSYLTDGEARLVQWDGKSRYEHITLPGNREGMKYLGTAKRLLYANGYVWFVPEALNGAYAINAKSGAACVWEALQPECEAEFAPELFDKFNAVWQNRDTIYALGSRSQALYIFNTLTGESKRVRITGDTLPVRAGAYRHPPERCEEAGDCLYGETGLFDVETFTAMIINAPDDGMAGRQSELAAKEYTVGGRGSGTAIYECCQALLSA
jgi:hypothetical protein